MIEFREGQTKLNIKKHKITLSKIALPKIITGKIIFDVPYTGCKIGEPELVPMLDLHLVYSEDKSSGYGGKFVRVITFDNRYELDFIRDQIDGTQNCEDEFDFLYFENGGYEYDKTKW